MKQRISAKFLRLSCFSHFFFSRKLLIIFFLLESFLFIELFNLRFFFSLKFEKIEWAKHDRKFLSRLHL